LLFTITTLLTSYIFEVVQERKWSRIPLTYCENELQENYQIKKDETGGAVARGDSIQNVGTKGKRPLGRPRLRCEDGIRMDQGRLAGEYRMDLVGSG
jgi:hypothetical protein